VADKALTLAARLGLPESASALSTRGIARASAGERDGIDEMRRAIHLAIEHGEGRIAANTYNNLAVTAWLYDGPQANIDLGNEGIEFAGRRGLTETAEFIASGLTAPLAELGHTAEALTDATRLADQHEPAGTIDFVEPRSIQLRLLTECGQHGRAPSPQPLLKTARDTAQPQIISGAVAAAAGLLSAQGKREQACLLLEELDRIDGTRTTPHFAATLPALVRTALALGRPDLATSLTEGVPPLTPIQEHALTSSQAHLAEAAGRHAEAATLYADAAQQWREFGNVPECAYALLGQGRCLRALGDPAAEKPLTEARELFASMGYKPALAETEALLQQAQAAEA
jgi:tetratricopeptide (TPR) repeat protein